MVSQDVKKQIEPEKWLRREGKEKEEYPMKEIKSNQKRVC